MKVNKMKGYIIGTIIGISIGATFFTYGGAFDSFTSMTQTWFEAVKTKLNGTYASDKMCVSDSNGQIQCINDVPTGGVDATILTKICQSVGYDSYNSTVGSEGCAVQPILSDWGDSTNTAMNYLLANRPTTQFTGTKGAGNVITDTVTGLMWESVPLSTIRTWDNANAYCAGLSLGGYTDWRMPDINELESIVDHSYSNSNFWYESKFTLVANDYWSSTTVATSTTDAHFLHFGFASTNTDPKTDTLRVICTR